MRDLGGPTLYRPRLGFSYVLPRLWDPGGVRSTPKVPTMHLDRSRSLSPPRYPYAPCKGHLVNLNDDGKTFVHPTRNSTYLFTGILLGAMLRR